MTGMATARMSPIECSNCRLIPCQSRLTTMSAKYGNSVSLAAEAVNASTMPQILSEQISTDTLPAASIPAIAESTCGEEP